ETRAEGRIHAYRLRSELPVHRAGRGPARTLRSEDVEAVDADRRSSLPQGIPGREVRAAAAVREHFPDLQGGVAPGGGLARGSEHRVAVDEEVRDRLVQESEKGRDDLHRVRSSNRQVLTTTAGLPSQWGPDHRHLH